MTRKPVVLGVPFDLQHGAWTGPADLPAPSTAILPRVSPMPPNPDDVARAARTGRGRAPHRRDGGSGCRRGGRGGGLPRAGQKLDAPLATTLPARGLFAGHPHCLGVAGGFSSDVARAVFAEADLIIAVGSSLASHNSDAGKLWPKARVLQIDTHPQAMSQGRLAAHAHLRADARLGAEALATAVATRFVTQCTPALAERIATTPADGSHFAPEPGLHDPRDVVSALEEHLPNHWQMVNSSGHCSYYFAHMPSRPHETFLTIREFGAIGNGTSFAMGVAAAKPGDTVVLFDGDGSLLMHAQELETIRRHGLNILIIVLNDRAYGSEIHKLRAEGLSDVGAVFGPTDLAAIARGFGIGGETITDLATLPALIADFAAKGGAAVWDVPISDRVFSPVIRRAHPELAAE